MGLAFTAGGADQSLCKRRKSATRVAWFRPTFPICMVTQGVWGTRRTSLTGCRFPPGSRLLAEKPRHGFKKASTAAKMLAGACADGVLKAVKPRDGDTTREDGLPAQGA